MKRIACFLLSAVLMLYCIPLFGNAAECGREVIRFEDGSYIVVEVTNSGARASKSTNGSKTSTFYNRNNVAQWMAELKGSFTYDGSSATCTSASSSVTIYNSDWYTVSKNASKSGSTATGSFSMGRKLLGSTVETKNISLKLSCDKNGNLS